EMLFERKIGVQTYAINATCTNLAGLKSTSQIIIQTDLMQTQDLMFIKPNTEYTSSIAIQIEVGTTRADDTCYYSINSPTNINNPLTKQPTPNQEGLTIFNTTANMQGTSSLIYARCSL